MIIMIMMIMMIMMIIITMIVINPRSATRGSPPPSDLGSPTPEARRRHGFGGRRVEI